MLENLQIWTLTVLITGILLYVFTHLLIMAKA